jgi:hypothetical protein
MVFGNSDRTIVEFNTVDCSYKAADGGAAGNIYNAYGTKAGGMDDCIWRYNFGMKSSAGFMIMGNSADTNQTLRGKVYNNIIINSKYFIESDHGGVDWEIYNNTSYNCTTFAFLQCYPETHTVVPVKHSFWNNLISGADVYNRSPSTPNPPTWSKFLTFADYNQANITGRWSVWNWNSSGNKSLADWRSASGFDTHSNIDNPGFVKAGGTAPADYKRTTYAANGRGGSFATVIGAYMTGKETIGCSFSSPPASDTTPPSSPGGVTIKVK